MHRTTLHRLLAAALALALALSVAPLAHAQTATPPPASISLNVIGVYETGIFDEGAAEIISYDPATQRAFVINSTVPSIDALDLSDPTAPALAFSIDIAPYGAGVNSVDVHDGVVAAAVEAEETGTNGSIVFFDTDGNFISQVEAGPLPDMVTFTPDGSKVLAANEGEPNDEYTVDPEGSVTIIDLAGGVENLTQDAVTQVGFTQFNDAPLDPSIRIFGPEATVAQDVEPEYIAVSPDSSTAYVTLQENNALGVVDIAASEAITLVGLGFKNYNAPIATVETFEFTDLPVLGTTAAEQEILLGGFSGLYFEGVNEETGALQFITHPDRGPNADTVDVDGDGVNERPFPLPGFQAQWVRFQVNPESGELSITEQIMLTRADGTPITGLPNLEGEAGMAHADEEPIDLMGNPLEYDPYGADMEGIVRAEDGTYWMVDEYRPAIYHFDAEGTLIERFVPERITDDEESEAEPVDVGTEALPAVFAERRANRGFEAVAYDNGMLYAFIQSPLDNPDTPGDTSSRASIVNRILEFDTGTGETVGQYIYLIEGGAVDKIGDAVALGDGEFLVIERDSAVGPEAEKFIFQIDISNATNLEELEGVPTGFDEGLEQQSELGLATVGITPVEKSLYVDLIGAGYLAGDKPEGLALINENTLAVLNDNDFGLLGSFDPATGLLDDNPNPITPTLGLITLSGTELDASNEDDGINIRNWPALGMYQPDAIAAYEANGETYLVTANEGDARDYDGFSEEVRVDDLLLDWSVFPNAAELQMEENLGRLNTTTVNGDTDGDGLVEEIYSYGARSFSIWDSSGNLVFDSGDQFEQITAEMVPEIFNSNGTVESFDSRSDDKGPEPEAVVTGEVDGRTYAFIALERIGGIMVYDVSDPTAPQFIEYANSTDFTAPAEEAGAVGPEGLKFVSADDSPTGNPLLLVSAEVSGDTTIFEITGGAAE
jgi:hypothetical protein